MANDNIRRIKVISHRAKGIEMAQFAEALPVEMRTIEHNQAVSIQVLRQQWLAEHRLTQEERENADRSIWGRVL